MKFMKPLIVLFALLLISFKGSALDAAMQQDILKYTNEYRKSKGKPPLKLDESINTQAEKHSGNMASGSIPLGHQGFKDRVKALESANTFVSGAAENVAYGNMTAKEVVNGWIKSPVHKKNLLGNYNYIGIGVAEGKTDIFILPRSLSINKATQSRLCRTKTDNRCRT